MKNRYPSKSKSAALVALLLAGGLSARAQNVGIGTTAPDVSAALDIVSSSKGALLPRVVNATAIATPATGLLVFQTGGTPGFYYNAGTPGTPNWQQIATAAGAAVSASNGLTKTGQNITLGGPLTGNTDIISNGNNLTLSGTGSIGIGTSTPSARLTIAPTTLEPKITLYEGSGGINYYGLGISNLQQNYHVGSNAGSHVFYAGGNNGNGTELLRIKNNGNVGIGTATPSQKLDVATGGIRAAAFGAFAGTAAADQGAHLQWNRTGSEGETWLINHLGLGGANAGIRFAGITTSTGTTPTEWARFLNNGNFGIGTTSPSALLDVNGTARVRSLTAGLVQADAQGNLSTQASGATNGLFWGLTGNSGTNPATNFLGTTDAQDQAFRTNNVEQMRLTTAGRLGLGTATPGAKLDIQGGADNNGANDPMALSFSWRAGGYRHFVRSRHNSDLSGSGNDLDFYLNNGNSGGVSTAPGTGNIQVMTLESYAGTPRVGIGTTAPSAPLEVQGGTAIDDATPVNSTQTLTRLYRPGSFDQSYGAAAELALGRYNVNTSTDAQFAQLDVKLGNNSNALADQTVMTLRGDGKVGVGTTIPFSRLSFGGAVINANVPDGRLAIFENQAAGTTGQFFYGLGLVQNTSGNYGMGLWGGSGAALPYNGSTGTLPQLYLEQNSNNVGINNIAPTATFDVNGSTRLRGLTVAGVVTTDASGNLSSTAAASLDATTASNGLTEVGTDIRLGGTLSQATTITQAGNTFSVTGGRVGLGTTSPGYALQLGDGTNGSAHALLQGVFAQTSYLRHGRLMLNDPNFGIGAGAQSATGGDDDLYFYAFNGPNRDIRFMHTDNGLTDPSGTGWTTDLIVKQGGNVGIGTITPVSQLANTGTNIIGTDNFGTSSQALNWLSTTNGYAGAFYSSANSASGNGLAVKVLNTSATALDVSQGASAGTAGTSLLRVNGNGNVGIGTASPTQKLDVVGTTNVSAAVVVDAAGANAGTFANSTAPANNGLRFGGIASGEGIASKRTSGGNQFGLDFYTNFVNRMTISNTGSVGIGTTAPGYPLQVVGGAVSSGAGSYLGFFDRTDATKLYNWYATGGRSTLNLTTVGVGNTDLFTVTNAGNVGIGTVTPAAKLTVQPSSDADQGLRVTDGTNNSNIVIQPLVGGNSGFQAINFNGYFNGGEQRFNASKLRWRMGVDQRGSGELFFIDTFNGTSGGNPFSISGNGYVGIGTTTPGVPLDVQAANTNYTVFNYGYLAQNGAGGPIGNSGTTSVSIRASNRIVAQEFNAVSDRRLKNVVGLSSGASDLNLLNKLRITDYTMRDRVQFGDQKFKKVIAQEVEEVFPQAVKKQVGFLPDVYASATQVQALPGDSLLLITLPAGLTTVATAGQHIKLIGESTQVQATVARATAVGSRTITVRGAQALAHSKVFVFGLEHADVRAVDYEALSMLNVSATQELARKIEALEKQNAALQAKSAQADADHASLLTLQAQMARLLGEAAPAGAQARK